MSAILTSIITVQIYIAWHTYHTHTAFSEYHANLTNFSQILSQTKCVVHKPAPLHNVFIECPLKTFLEKSASHDILQYVSYQALYTRVCTWSILCTMETIHQSQHSAAFTQSEAILWICGRWSPIIISSIVSLFAPTPIWKSTSWPNRTANTQWCPWKPFSLKVRLYFPWRINRRRPKWWSIMTIICWTWMKSGAWKKQYR